ncbi:MAG: CotH kinase family protein, partial [Planctomycetota bacterium]|nr:CotH kinase family protein [Planctomycetota bacterium]
FAFLNRIIKGRAKYTVDHYLAKVDYWVWMVAGFILVGGLLLLMIQRHFGNKYFRIVAQNGHCRQFHCYWIGLPLCVPLVCTVPLFLFNKGAWDELRDGNFSRATQSVYDNGTTYLNNLIYSPPVPTHSKLPTLNLYVKNTTLADMLKAGSAKPYFKAVLGDENNELLNCKIRMRGRSTWHFQPEKPSIRIRIKKSEIYQGRRYLELTRPEDPLALKNWIPQHIAGQIGLLTDRSDHVRLFINNRYFGVYTRSLRTGERLAIENGRLPGTFFKGDALNGGMGLWTSSKGWKIDGERAPENIAQFDRFLKLLKQSPSVEAVANLQTVFDMDVYAKWAALMATVGGTHDDKVHNHTYFLCSNQGKIEVIPWDTNGFGFFGRVAPDNPVDEIRHPVARLVLADPAWVHRRNRYVHELLESHARPDTLSRLIDEAVGRTKADMESEVYFSTLLTGIRGTSMQPSAVTDIPLMQAELKDWIRQRHAFLKKYLSQTDVRVQRHPTRPKWSLVAVGGSVAVHVFQGQHVAKKTENNKTNTDLLYPGFAKGNKSDYGYYLEPKVIYYEIEGEPDTLHFRNSITGMPVTVRTLHDSVRGNAPSVVRREKESPTRDEVVLGPGTIVLRDDLSTLPGQTLIIRPGTTIRMGAGVGIYPRGKVLIEGRQDKWVKIEPADNEPWASMGISGAATKGSCIEYLRLTGGSIGTNGSARFKGMLSIYNCPNVILRHCEFGKNLVGDDAVNLAESRVLVEDCTWNDARADALDLDMCVGTVRRCRLNNSGNDGLDLMTCQLLIEDCQISGSGDKGISIGEQSSVVARQCEIHDCLTGTEIKDASRLLLRDSRIANATLAVNSYQKKWVYPGGGMAALVNCVIQNSRETDIQAAKRCQIILVRSPVASIQPLHSARITSTEELNAVWKRHEGVVLGIAQGE